MARVSNTLIGKASGSVGNATFSSWKGINVLKEKATTVANPNTIPQQNQRVGFALFVEVFRKIPTVVRLGFKKLAVKQSEFNAFIAANVPNALNFGVPGSPVIDAGDVFISKGTLAGTVITSILADRSNNSILIAFPIGITGPGQSLTDLSLGAVYNSTRNDWAASPATEVRSAGTCTIVMPAIWAVADVVTGYLGFANQLDGNSSDSQSIAGVITA